jgi:hypothetical protein
MYSTHAYAKKSADASFEKITIQRNEPGDDDVQFDIGKPSALNGMGHEIECNFLLQK